MRRIFVDTSAWAALTDSKDANHAAAVVFMQQIARKASLVMTDYVLDETYTLLLVNVGYAPTVQLKRKFDVMRKQDILEIFWVTETLVTQAWAIFERFNVDKQWSFTDCISYAAMKKLSITEVFSFDHHFSQMGFIRQP